MSGAVVPAQMLVRSNFLLELVPEYERPLYMGVSNTLIGIAMVLSGLVGGLADLLGFAGVFGATLILLVIAYQLASGLPEPRREQLRAIREPAGAEAKGERLRFSADAPRLPDCHLSKSPQRVTPQ